MVGVAVAAALKPDDQIFSNHRCHGHFLARTGNVDGLVAEIMGRKFPPWIPLLKNLACNQVVDGNCEASRNTGTSMHVRRHKLRLSSSTKCISPESCTSTIGLITLDEKQTGERSAGNPHATFDAAGAETQLTMRLVRHSQRKRGATDRSNLRSMASALDPTVRKTSTRKLRHEKFNPT
jgi:hypothetical protein